MGISKKPYKSEGDTWGLFPVGFNEELYQLQKIYLSRGTMARWLIRVSRELMPIWNILEEKVLDCGYMAIDATQVQVLKEKGRSPQSKSSMGSGEL